MGLFDRLFGKKKQEETNHDGPVSETQPSEITEALNNREATEQKKYDAAAVVAALATAL